MVSYVLINDKNPILSNIQVYGVFSTAEEAEKCREEVIAIHDATIYVNKHLNGEPPVDLSHRLKILVQEIKLNERKIQYLFKY